MLYKINSNSNDCLLSELPSASVRLRHTGAAAAAHSLEFEVSGCDSCDLKYQSVPQGGPDSCVERPYSYTVFDTGPIDGLKEVMKSLVASLSCVFQFSVTQVRHGILLILLLIVHLKTFN